MTTQFEDFIHGAMVRMSEQRRAEATNLRLGNLIAELKEFDPALPVALDSGGSVSHFHSYRGYYEDLAVEPTEKPRTVADLLAEAQAARGAMLEHVLDCTGPRQGAEHG